MRKHKEKVLLFLSGNKHYILLCSVVLFTYLLFKFAYLLQPQFKSVMGVASYLTWHNILEFISILVSFGVFAVTYYTYNQTKNLKSAFLGSVFLATGFIDMFHTLSFKGMADFFIPNISANRATTFWIFSSLIAAIGFIVSSFLPTYSQKKIRKPLLVIPSLCIALIVLIVVTYFPKAFPAMYIDGVGLTPVKKALEYVIMVLFGITLVTVLIEHKKTKDFPQVLFALAILLRICSRVAFVSYVGVYDIYNYLGHIYRFIAFFIIFRVIFIYNIQKPYNELSMAKKEIDDYANNLDRLVDRRTEQLKTVNQKLMEDLIYARDIQRAMLPLNLPSNETVGFCARYFPAESVGGDFYNVFKLDENNIGMYIGDVAGHGVSAAMLMIFLNQCVTVTKELYDGKLEIMSPSSVLEDVYLSFNNTNFRDHIYAVMFYAVYDTSSRELTFSSAGMNVAPLIIYNTGVIAEMEIKGLPICKFSEFYHPQYHNTTLKLSPGDKVLFYTDGIIDAENQNREKFSEERLKVILEKGHAKNCANLSEYIEDNLFGFTGSYPLKDDITFFMMEVT